MELKEGYKQTDVGVIPEDWKLGDFHHSVTYTHGKAHEPFVADWGTYTIVNSKFIASEGAVKKFATSNFCPAQNGDVLMVLSDLPNGRALAKTYTAGSEASLLAVNQRVVRLRPNPLCCDRSYAGYAINRHPYFLKFDDGVTQTHLLNKHLDEFKFPLPAMKEQRAIAEVLSDVDAEIESLARRQEKLVRQKQALSEELLSGRTRLVEPKSRGFKQTEVGVIPEDWESIQFGECGSIHGGLSGKSAQDFFQEANCQFVTFTSVMQNISIGAESLSRVQVEDGERQFEVERGDLIFNGSSETPEEVAMASVAEEMGQHVFLNSFCFALRPNQSKVHPLFVAYWCRAEFGRRCFSQLAQGSTRYNVSKALFKRAQLPYPPLPEQLAIAEVLSDVDAEIQAVAKLKAKVQAKKEGLMQTLLTGKIRLT